MSQLTEENLKRLERETSRNMDFVITRTRKRGLLGQASSSDLNPDTETKSSQKSSASNAFYRFYVLEGVKMFSRPEPPPNEIRSPLEGIPIYKTQRATPRKPSELVRRSPELIMRSMNATLERLRASSISRERAKKRLKRRFKFSATKIRSSKKSFTSPRLKLRAFRLLTRSSMS